MMAQLFFLKNCTLNIINSKQIADLKCFIQFYSSWVLNGLSLLETLNVH